MIFKAVFAIGRRLSLNNWGRSIRNGISTSINRYSTQARPLGKLIETFKPTHGYVTSIAVTQQGRVVAAENKKIRDSLEVRHEVSRVNVYDSVTGEIVGECESVDGYIDDPSEPRLVYPTSYHDVAVFNNGNIAVKCKLYTKERDWAGCVGIFNPEGTFIKFLGERWVLNHGLAVNNKNDVILGVWDEEETPYRVCVYSEDGKLKREIADDTFGPSMSLAVNVNDDIILADYTSGIINVLNSKGKHLFEVKIRNHMASSLQADGVETLAICTDTDGNIFCVDERSARVHMISRDGKVHEVIISPEVHPEDALVSPKAVAAFEGSLLIAESDTSNLVKMFKYT